MKQELYQVHVETLEGTVIPVGPRMLKEYAEGLLMAINGAVSAGREKSWSNAHLARATTN